jgi:hypothetical protein
MKKKLKSLCPVVWRGLFVLLLFHGTRCFGHDSFYHSPEKCEYCGSVSDEKVEKFFHDLFKAGVVITLCNGLVVVPLWWWSVRRRPFLDVDSWTNVQVHTPLPASASAETEVKP